MVQSNLSGVRPEIREIMREAERYGWTVSRRRSNHYKLKGPEGQTIFCSGTPSDRRAVMNLRRDLTHAGLDLRKVAK